MLATDCFERGFVRTRHGPRRYYNDSSCFRIESRGVNCRQSSDGTYEDGRKVQARTPGCEDAESAAPRVRSRLLMQIQRGLSLPLCLQHRRVLLLHVVPRQHRRRRLQLVGCLCRGACGRRRRQGGRGR